MAGWSRGSVLTLRCCTRAIGVEGVAEAAAGSLPGCSDFIPFSGFGVFDDEAKFGFLSRHDGLRGRDEGAVFGGGISPDRLGNVKRLGCGDGEWWGRGRDP